MSKLAIIKLTHTAIWLIMASASFYILYAGITDTTTPMLWVSIGLLSLETLVLLANKWTCPLTPMARKHTAEQSDNFDIYLPLWLARHNKLIFGSIFAAGLLLLGLGSQYRAVVIFFILDTIKVFCYW
jgi:hypothetical protein